MGNDWTEESRRKIAYLEVGHALVAFYNALPVHMASTVPTLGLASHKQMLAKLDALMGGRVAEEEIFGKSKVTFGACSTFDKSFTSNFSCKGNSYSIWYEYQNWACHPH
jgi:ATP-dependent metalloprotease